jgi:hypothetical protein
MRHQYCGTSNNCTGKLQVCSGHSRILHQVDRGEASSQYSRSGAQKILLAKHNMSFWVPKKITVDNAKQFDYHIFKDFCHQMGVKATFASVYHPQSNRVVERANALIFSSIKKILEDQPKGKWVEELSRAVWSHNTSVSRATNFTPFKLLYGGEPVTPEEIEL